MFNPKLTNTIYFNIFISTKIICFLSNLLLLNKGYTIIFQTLIGVMVQAHKIIVIYT